MSMIICFEICRELKQPNLGAYNRFG